MGRTAEEIRNAVYEACLGDYTDDDARIRDAQHNLVSALIWHECPPTEGWETAFHRQIDQLKGMQEPERSDDIFADMTDPDYFSPKQTMDYLGAHMLKKEPWDVAGIDEDIQAHK